MCPQLHQELIVAEENDKWKKQGARSKLAATAEC